MRSATVALVHGAFSGSGSWSGVAERLEARGHPVLCIPNPLRGLSADAAYVRAVLGSLDGPLVVAGHAYGGAVIGEAARGAAGVCALVYVAAYILDEGETVESVLDPASFPGSLYSPATTLIRRVPGAGDGEVWIRIPDFPRVFAADLRPYEAHLMALAQRPISLDAVREAAGVPAWRALPSWALVSENDRVIPAAGQRWMAARAGARTSSVPAAHAVTVTRPDAVADVLHEAAIAVG
jgi:pimeloyl-ACP methyl ester carboxylesterase